MVNALACVDRVHGQTLEHYMNITEIFIDFLSDNYLSSYVQSQFRHSSRQLSHACKQDTLESHMVWDTESMPNGDCE